MDLSVCVDVDVYVCVHVYKKVACARGCVYVHVFAHACVYVYMYANVSV